MKNIALLFAITLVGCATPHPQTAHLGGFNLRSQSWDQENLKRNDHGCPTAIFIAPDGNLIQCDD